MSVKRGYGALEGFLAKQRARIANRLIPGTLRLGKILDIGCGSYPYFLLNTSFYEKHGIDSSICLNGPFYPEQKMFIKTHDIEKERKAPYEDNSFDVVSMLAVFEHIEPERLVEVLREILRVMKPGGVFIMTTPAIWADALLRVMARLKLVSSDEIAEHKDAYNRSKIVYFLTAAGFRTETMKFGYFEFFLNQWILATK